MQEPTYGRERLTMFVADDASATDTASQLAQEPGFEVFNAGPLRNARYLEPMAMLWIHLCFRRGVGPNFGYRVVRR